MSYCPDSALILCSLGSQISHLPCNTKANVSGVGVGVTVQNGSDALLSGVSNITPSL